MGWLRGSSPEPLWRQAAVQPRGLPVPPTPPPCSLWKVPPARLSSLQLVSQEWDLAQVLLFAKNKSLLQLA